MHLHFLMRQGQLFLLVFACLFSFAHSEISQDKIKVALFLDKGAHPRSNLKKVLESATDMTLTMINGEEIREGILNDIDLLIIPGGSSIVESMSMKEEGKKEVRHFVHKGGLYLGICAGCYLLTEAKSTDLGLLPLNTIDKAHWRRGKGMLPIELTKKGQEIFGTDSNLIEVLYHNGPVIDDSHITLESDFTVLAYYRGELVKKGGKPGVMVGTPAMFMGKFGKGLVMGISPHPEADPGQVSMELNAIRWLYKHRHHSNVNSHFLRDKLKI